MHVRRGYWGTLKKIRPQCRFSNELLADATGFDRDGLKIVLLRAVALLCISRDVNDGEEPSVVTNSPVDQSVLTATSNISNGSRRQRS